MAKKGDWVLTHTTVLAAEQRTGQIPDDTKSVPLEQWVKGFLTADAEIGDEVEVVTRTGRLATGTLLEVGPHYTHDFGDFVPEILEIGSTVRGILFGGEE